MNGFSEEELSAFDQACERSAARLRKEWQRGRARDPREKPSQAQIRHHNKAMAENARLWKNWEPK